MTGPGPSHTRIYAGNPDGTGGIRPDFVLVGIPVPDGVELWASTELTYAELEAETRYRRYEDYSFEELFASPYYPPPEVVSHTVTLRAGLARFVVVRAPSYPEALAALIKHPGWEPGAGPAAITGG